MLGCILFCAAKGIRLRLAEVAGLQKICWSKIIEILSIFAALQFPYFFLGVIFDTQTPKVATHKYYLQNERSRNF